MKVVKRLVGGCKPTRATRALVSGFLSAVGLATLCLLPLRAAAPTWTTVGSMSTERFATTVTPLNDGRVLAAGGVSASGSPLDTTELFDPITNTWSPAASMATHRALHIAGALADGRVLVAGGQVSNGSASATNTAEIYDPVANTWSGAASMLRRRTAASAVAFGDGRVLVVGGTNGTDVFNDGEVYDPDTNTWTLTGPTTSAREYAIAALLTDGRVLAAGGVDQALSSLRTAEIYDPDTNAWSPAHSMASPRATATAVVLNDDRVFVVGGIDTAASSFFTDGEVYDPAANSWTTTPSTGAIGGSEPTAALRADGAVLVVGGLVTGSINGGASTAAALYDPGSNTWSPSNPPAVPRYGSIAVPIPGARTLVTGGLFSGQTDVYGAPNNPPSANAGPDQTINGCAWCLGLVILDGSRSGDPDHDSLVYEWREGGTLLASTTDPVKVTTIGLGLGVHTLTLTVTDGAGGTARDDIRIEVVDAEGTVGAQLAQCQADRQALANGLEATLASIEQNLRTEFKNPLFTIPGGTSQARLQNLGFAVTAMTRGQKMGLYRGLGGN